jgi:hypothetical protein
MGKYDALRHFLKQIPLHVREKTLTFDEIEKVLSFTLPESAYKYRAWWANSISPKQHPHAQSWLASGWTVDTVNFQGKRVCFRRGKQTKSIYESVRPSSENSLNPGKGKQFQKRAAKLLADHFLTLFRLDYPIAIGVPPKDHRFDLVSSDLRYIGECKNYSWTKSGNVPSAKMGFVNEAVFYLSFLPKDRVRFVVMRKDIHSKRNETLADYYYRTYRHLLQGVLVLEMNLENDTIRKLEDAS